MPVPQRFPGIRWIRFTLRFWEAITIAATFAVAIARERARLVQTVG